MQKWETARRIGSSGSVTNCDQFIANRICSCRDMQIILDRDLARLYDVEVKQLNRQVQRNIERFLDDFMFRLGKDEVENLKCQNGTSSWGGDRYLPYAFTEQGIAMISGRWWGSVLVRSEKLVKVKGEGGQ